MQPVSECIRSGIVQRARNRWDQADESLVMLHAVRQCRRYCCSISILTGNQSAIDCDTV